MSLSPELYKKLVATRREQLQKELVNNPLYVEYKQLSLELDRLNGNGPKVIVTELDAGEKRDARKGGSKDMSNSPSAHVRHGHRIEHVYNLMDDIVQENGGKALIKDIRDHLVEEHDMNWEDNGVKNSISRLSTYILTYNKLNPDDQRLSLVKGYDPAKPAKGTMPYREVIRKRG